MTTNGYTANVFQSADDENALSMANSISQDLIGVDAQDSGVQPTKAQIINKINDTQRELCNERDWTFLNKITMINGYELETTSGVSSGATTGVSGYASGMTGTGNVSPTDYWAEKITSDTSFLSKVLTGTVLMGSSGTGFGAVSGTTYLLICPDLNGRPDTANAVLTSDALIPTVPSSQFITNTFTFTNNTTLLDKNTTYWLVLKFVGAADNGDGIAVDYGSTASTSTFTNFNNAGTWTAFTTGRMVVSINYTQADFTRILTLSNDVQKVYRLYNGDLDQPTENLLPFAGSKLVNYPEDLPSGSFVLRYLTNGEPVIYINSSLQSKSYVLEYKQTTPTIAADNDLCVVPKNYRGLLKNLALYYFMTVRGMGMQDSGALAELKETIERQKKALRREYLNSPMMRLEVKGRQVTSFENPYLTRNVNRTQVR